MAKNSGLGRGLEALFSESNVLNEIKENEKQFVKEIDINNIEPNTTQARKKFDTDSINELANSIKTYGVLEPIIVEDKGKYYRIIAGERRWRASKKAGLKTIPCIIRDEDEQKNKEISLIENIQRENLNPIEKAFGYKELIDNYNLTQAELAEKLGISRSYVANTLRILNLDKRVIELANDGKLTEAHLRNLASINDSDKQYEVAMEIVRNDGTVKDIEKIVKRGKPIKKSKKYESLCRDMEDSFEQFFGTKVKVDAGPKSGKIIIKYSTNDELERILNLIKKED